MRAVAEALLTVAAGEDGVDPAADAVPRFDFHPSYGTPGETPGRLRHGAEQSPHREMHPIAVVSSEEFIARVARQGDRHMSAGHLADQVGRDLGRVSERFVVDRGQPRYDVERLGRRYVQ